MKLHSKMIVYTLVTTFLGRKSTAFTRLSNGIQIVTSSSILANFMSTKSTNNIEEVVTVPTDVNVNDDVSVNVAAMNAYDKVSMEDIVSLCKRRGFIYPSSEIYNGMAGFYDYGPLG